jgi:hypothetical protein
LNTTNGHRGRATCGSSSAMARPKFQGFFLYIIGVCIYFCSAIYDISSETEFWDWYNESLISLFCLATWSYAFSVAIIKWSSKFSSFTFFNCSSRANIVVDTWHLEFVFSLIQQYTTCWRIWSLKLDRNPMKEAEEGIGTTTWIGRRK